MRKVIALLLLTALIVSSFTIIAKPASCSTSTAGNTWVSKTPMNQARGGLGVAVVDGRIYAIGGSTRSTEGGGGIVGTNEEYNPVTDRWTYKASMPTPRMSFAIAVYRNKIYCMGGTTDYSSYSNLNEVYDPATDTWKTETPMPTARLGLQANVVNDKIYLIGGVPNGTLNEVYDPTADSWTTKAPMPTPTGFVSAVLDNKIYAVGTYYNGSYVSTTQIYNPETDSWNTGASPLSSINGGGSAVAAATTGQMAPRRIYVYGQAASEPTYSLQVYDPDNNSWTYGSDKPTTCDYASIGIVNDEMYFIGGITKYSYEGYLPGYTKPSAVNEEYTPFGFGTVPPIISVDSPSNRNYTSNEIPLNFTVNKPVDWLGYSLDGNQNITITGNTTVTGLTSGSHNITIYAKDTFNNTGSSGTITFRIAPEPFPTAQVAGGVTAIIIGVGLIVYFKKYRH